MTDESNKATTPTVGRGLDEATLESVKRHISGTIVVHSDPFEELPIPVPREQLSREFIDRWVVPLYMTLRNAESEPILESLWPKMNGDVAYALLAATDWRPRRVGAYIVALRELHELTDEVGGLLLRSDVCYAGGDYCLALAQLNAPRSRKYLQEYLDYYLTRHDLWFGQSSAISAIAYLDEVNGMHDLWIHFFPGGNPSLPISPGGIWRRAARRSENIGRITALYRQTWMTPETAL